MEAEGTIIVISDINIIIIMFIIIIMTGLRAAADTKENERKLSIHYENLLNNLAR